MAGSQLAWFLRDSAAPPFAYGRRDCLLWLADWGRHVSGSDAARNWRGRCSTALGAARILKRHGGMVQVTAAAFEAEGWRRTESPRRGDVAIVEGREGLTGAICLGRELYAMARFNGAIQIRRVAPLAAWTWEGECRKSFQP